MITNQEYKSDIVRAILFLSQVIERADDMRPYHLEIWRAIHGDNENLKRFDINLDGIDGDENRIQAISDQVNKRFQQAPTLTK